MLGIVTMAGNALRSFGSIHPAIKWGVVAIVGLLAVEFIGKEAISLYVDISTAPDRIRQVKEQALRTKTDSDAAHFIMNPNAFGDVIKEQQGQDVPPKTEAKDVPQCVIFGGRKTCAPEPDK